MIKKLRIQVIKLGMLSLAVILIFLIAVLNITNYISMTREADHLLEEIAANDNRFPAFRVAGMFGMPYGTEETTRYFAVIYNEDGTVERTIIDNRSSISDEEAEEITSGILNKNTEFGYSGDYRYYRFTEDEKVNVLCLNTANQQHFIDTLLKISLIVFVFSMLALMGIVILLSKRLLEPYVRNHEAQKRFITNASHEIKTPLTSIATSADILALDEPENEWVVNIQKQSSRLAKLVNDLVMLSRFDEAVPILQKTDLSLTEILYESVKPCTAGAYLRKVDVQTDIEENLVLNGDRATISRLVTILLDNASKYTNDGGKIIVKAYRQSKHTVLEIYNTCEAIDPKNLDRLFERFYRDDPSHSTEIKGYGIGLAMAKAIVESHNADIKAESDDGRSLRMTVTF